MIVFAGILLLGLGVLSGLSLLLSPFGLAAAAGLTAWVLFPGFTIVGFVLIAVVARTGVTAFASRIAGACLVLLALGAGLALFALGNALLRSEADPAGLWYVLGLGLVLGTSGFAIGHAAADSLKA